jgi:hypothetical protein
MPRVKGKVNYKKEVLLQVVREVLPSGALGWEEVTRIYQERSSEEERRNGDDVKRHWQEKCCNKFQKPTGATGAQNDFIYRAQEVQRQIMKNNQMSIMSTDNSSEDEEEVNAQKVGSDEEWFPAEDGDIEGDDRGIDAGAGGDVEWDDRAGGDVVGTEGDVLKAVAAAAAAFAPVASATASASSNNMWISKRGMKMLDKIHVSDEPLDVDPLTPKSTKIPSNKTKNSSSSNKQRANIGKSLERLCDSLSESSKAIFAPSASESQAIMLQMMQQQMSQQTAMMQLMMNSFAGKKRKKHKKKHRKKRRKKSKSERVEKEKDDGDAPEEIVKECDGGESKKEESDSNSSSSSSSSSGDYSSSSSSSGTELGRRVVGGWR